MSPPTPARHATPRLASPARAGPTPPPSTCSPPGSAADSDCATRSFSASSRLAAAARNACSACCSRACSSLSCSRTKISPCWTWSPAVTVIWSITPSSREAITVRVAARNVPTASSMCSLDTSCTTSVRSCEMSARGPSCRAGAILGSKAPANQAMMPTSNANPTTAGSTVRSSTPSTAIKRAEIWFAFIRCLRLSAARDNVPPSRYVAPRVVGQLLPPAASNNGQ